MFRSMLAYTLILGVTLVIFDLALIFLGLFPPQYERGEPDLGWATVAPRAMPYDACMDMTANVRVDYFRNELGIRTEQTAEQLRADDSELVVAAVGDSHSDQCMPNADTHQGVLERRLAERGHDVLLLSNGVGRYSPLQAYLLFEKRLTPFDPDVLVLNLYTGNDFVDILRIDDRPHFVAEEDGYRIAEPVWMRYADPDETYRSRLMFIARKLGDSTGIRDKWTRLKLLSQTAGSDSGSLADKWRYIRDIRKSVEPTVGYSGALSAQFLNQQLYFHHFPDAPAEALRRIDELLEAVRRDHPDLLLVMSPIPSYQLVTAANAIDQPLVDTLARLPVDDASCRELERSLYDALQSMAVEHDWLFVDNLAALADYDGDVRLYNDFDYHVTDVASLIIGDLEAQVIADALAAPTRR